MEKIKILRCPPFLIDHLFALEYYVGNYVNKPENILSMIKRKIKNFFKCTIKFNLYGNILGIGQADIHIKEIVKRVFADLIFMRKFKKRII